MMPAQCFKCLTLLQHVKINRRFVRFTDPEFKYEVCATYIRRTPKVCQIQIVIPPGLSVPFIYTEKYKHITVRVKTKEEANAFRDQVEMGKFIHCAGEYVPGCPNAHNLWMVNSQ